MARARKQMPWDPMFRRIQAVYRSEWLYSPKPSTTDLDKVGALLGINFPASYQAFAQEFGLDGTLHVLPDVLSLTRPLWARAGEWFASVLDATQFLRPYFWDHPDHLENTGPPDLTERMVVFARDEGQHTFLFDPADVTDARWRECRIYNISRDGSVEPIADSFGDWLQWIDEHYRFDHEKEETGKPVYPVVMKPDSADPSPMSYWRRCVREKNGPEVVDVQTWLTWNNGTIRNLAISIRDDPRPNSFPILADALEEAGCTNEDLLNSCRTGDPDIDGAWVLVVLLETKMPRT